jgi:phytoene desaturase
MYAGLAPDAALALYAVITYMDSINGVYFPEGGMHAMPTALATAAEKAGASLRYGDSVTEILRSSAGRVAGVRTAAGEQIPADAVVCTVDLPVAYRTFLSDLKPPRAARSGSYSPSAVVWHVGVRGVPEPPIAHHNIHFGDEWGSSFDDLLKHGQLMRDPSRLVTVPSLDEPGAAPDGSSTLYVLEPVPNLDAPIDWATERPRIRDDLAAFLAEAGYPGEVEAELLVDPVDWRAQGLTRGTPFSIDHRFLQSGPFRPDNHDRRVPGLYFTGADTRPGVGVPMVLISGELTARRIRDEVLR